MTEQERHSWEDENQDVIKQLLEEKFLQCYEFRQCILDNRGCIFAEATTSDKRWGTGLNPAVTAVAKPEYWPGKNLLGALITEMGNDPNDLLDELVTRNTQARNEEEKLEEDENSEDEEEYWSDYEDKSDSELIAESEKARVQLGEMKSISQNDISIVTSDDIEKVSVTEKQPEDRGRRKVKATHKALRTRSVSQSRMGLLPEPPREKCAVAFMNYLDEATAIIHKEDENADNDATVSGEEICGNG